MPSPKAKYNLRLDDIMAFVDENVIFYLIKIKKIKYYLNKKNFFN